MISPIAMHKPTPPDPNLAARIRAARIALSLSQVIAAARSGVALGTIRAAERYGFATPRTLDRLARAYGTSIDDLRGRLVEK